MAKLSKADKILITMYKMGNGKVKPIEYERLVVEAFQDFPEDFSLRGYIGKYPNSSDIHKPLYGPLKKNGYVQSAKKSFLLTERGISRAGEIFALDSKTEDSKKQRLKPQDLPRDVEAEIKRVITSEGYKLFGEDKLSDIVDTDFYQYLGATARTHHITFSGRVKTMEDVINTAQKCGLEQAVNLEKYSSYLLKRFDSILKAKTKEATRR